jgi:hypothetical protein
MYLEMIGMSKQDQMRDLIRMCRVAMKSPTGRKHANRPKPFDYWGGKLVVVASVGYRLHSF